MKDLSVRFSRLCGPALGTRKWFVHFESWLWARRAAGQLLREKAAGRGVDMQQFGCEDPCFPSGDSSLMDAELVRKLEAAGIDKKGAVEMCQQLGKLSSDHATQLACQLKPGNTAAAVLLSTVLSDDDNPTGAANKVCLRCENVELELNSKHLRKLTNLFNLTRGGSETAGVVVRGEQKREENDFSDLPNEVLTAVFCCLCRYQTACGGNPRAGGMQVIT